MVFEALACFWCEYLKGVITLTTRRKLFFINGRNSTTPIVKELVMCPVCDNELPMSVLDQIKLIRSFKPELEDWITVNPLYSPER